MGIVRGTVNTERDEMPIIVKLCELGGAVTLVYVDIDLRKGERNLV